MDMTKTLGIGAIILIFGGIGWFAFSNQSIKDDVMMQKEENVVQKDDTTMEKKDTVMTDTSDETMMKKDEGTTMAATETMMKTGSYEPYSADKIAKAGTGNVVLFFRASWCPTCRTVDADIKANLKNIPSDLTILDVNYDDSTSLKQQYGVTYQHTFVQVDAQGNLIKKWSGSPTLAALVLEVT